jgi:hypothetical protein
MSQDKLDVTVSMAVANWRRKCRVLLLLHLASLAAEIGIVSATIVFYAESDKKSGRRLTTERVFILASSSIVTIAVTMANIVGIKTLLHVAHSMPRALSRRMKDASVVLVRDFPIAGEAMLQACPHCMLLAV